MEYIKKNRFLLFLIFLLGVIAFTPFIRDPGMVELFSTINYTLILLSGMYAFRKQRYFLRSTTLFFIITIALDWFRFFGTFGNFLNTIQPLVTAAVLMLLLVMTLNSIRVARIADQNVIFGVVCGYVLIGYIGAFLAMAISWSDPYAYNLPGAMSNLEAIYYSFVTMTTLGYGDISPATHHSRSLAVLLSILGPMYVAIIVALMVGKFAASKETGK